MRFTAARCRTLDKIRSWIDTEHFGKQIPAPVPEIAVNVALIRMLCSLQNA